MDDIQDALEGITGARSVNIAEFRFTRVHCILLFVIIQVPRVFVNGTFIGGGSDVRKMSQNGKLEELLKK